MSTPFTTGFDESLLPKGDPARQAIASLRGYSYQIVASSLAWINIGDKERIYLEVAEDYSRVAQESVENSANRQIEAVQVKETGASQRVTLNTDGVKAAIESFVDLTNRNSGDIVSLRYLTTSEVACERPPEVRFGGEPGLIYWWKAARGADPTPLRNFLESERFSGPVRDFVKSLDDEQLRKKMLLRISWDCGQPKIEVLKDNLKERVVVICRDRFSIPAAEASGIVDRIIFYSLETALRAKPVDRVLKKADLYELIDRASRVSIPRGAIDAGLLQLLMSLSGAKSEMAAQFSPSGNSEYGWIINGQSLTAPRTQIFRASVINEVLPKLYEHGCTVLIGATGLGKSSVARMISTSIGASFLLVDLRGADPIEARQKLDIVFGRIGGELGETVIFEDLNHLDDPRVSRSFGRIREINRFMGRSCVVTCYSKPALRSMSEAGIHPESVVECPYFSESESKEVVTAYGGDAGRWGKVAHIAGAFGHPQLVDAFVAGAASRDWPLRELTSFVGNGLTSGDVAAEKEAARKSLISALPENAQALLFRLSLMVGRFTRPRALALADVQPAVLAAGAALDLLVGPWIEPFSHDQFRVSPLAGTLGQMMLSAKSQETLHAAIALDLLSSRRISMTDADAVMMHSLLGKSAHAIFAVARSIIFCDSEYLPALAEHATITRVLKLDGMHLGDGEWVKVFVRLAQFKLLSASNSPLEAAAAAEAAMVDASKLAERQLSPSFSSMSRVVVISTVLSTIGVADYLSNWVLWLKEFRSIMQEGIIPAQVSRNMVVGDGGDNHKPDKVLFSIGSANLTSVRRLEGIFSALDEIEIETRTEWLSRVDGEVPNLSVIVNTPWMNEQKGEALDARDAATRYARMAHMAQGWGMKTLAAHLWASEAVMFDEFMSDSVAALDILEAASTAIGHNVVLERARAKVFFRSANHLEALSIFRNIADMLQSDDGVEKTFALREAAISAVHCTEWQLAERWFDEACFTIGTRDYSSLKIMRMGLEADSAVVALEHSSAQKAVIQLRNVLTQLKSVDPDSSLGAAYLHRVVRHTVLWAKSRVSSESITIKDRNIEMVPGSNSNPNPPELIRQHPLGSIDIAWYMLASVESLSGLDVGVTKNLANHLEGEQIPFMELELRNDRLKAAIAAGDVKAFAASLPNYTYGMSFFLSLSRNEWFTFNPLNPPRGIIPDLDGDNDQAEQLGSDAIVCFLLYSLFEGRPDIISSILDMMEMDSGAKEFGSRLINISSGQINDLGSRIVQFIGPLSAKEMVHPRTHVSACLTIFNFLAGSALARFIYPSFSAWMRRTFDVICMKQGFLLLQPRQAIPAIQSLINKDLSDRELVASLILVAADAVGLRLGDSFISALAEQIRQR